MDYFPIFVDLRDKRCVVVGGGVVAARKAEALVRAAAKVHVIAPQLGDAVRELVAAARASYRAGEYVASDLEGAALVIAATDDALVNAAVSRDARALGLLVNVVDQPELSTFIVPALVDRSPVLIAVSSGGAAPVLARTLRGKLESNVPAGLGSLATVCSALRNDVKARLPSVPARRAFWEDVLESSAAERALAGDTAAAERAMREQLAAHAAGKRRGELVCIGAGPGDPDLVSFRAQRAMLRAELVLISGEVPRHVLDLCRRDAERRVLGALSEPSFVAISVELRTRVERGERICWLAPGDAFRAAPGESVVAAARAAGLDCSVVPGIAP